MRTRSRERRAYRVGIPAGPSRKEEGAYSIIPYCRKL